MSEIFKFLLKINELKSIKRKGISFYGVGDPDSAVDHSFRMALMVWVFGSKKDIKLERVIKMALIHDLAKIDVGDITPYEGLLPKGEKDKQEFVGRWRRLSIDDKEKRHNDKKEKEKKALKGLIKGLSKDLKLEIMDIWSDYHNQRTKEAKFVHQVDVLENLLEALEKWRENDTFPTLPWWEHAEEVIEDPDLLIFLKEIEKDETGKLD